LVCIAVSIIYQHITYTSNKSAILQQCPSPCECGQCPASTECSTPQLESHCVSGSSTTSPLTFEIDYIGCLFSRELNTNCVSWCTSVCIRPHQHTSLNCAHRCLNQPIVVISVQLLGVTLQFTAPEQRDTSVRTVARTQIHLLTYLSSLK